MNKAPGYLFPLARMVLVNFAHRLAFKSQESLWTICLNMTLLQEKDELRVVSTPNQKRGSLLTQPIP